MSICEYDSHCCSILSDQKSLTPKYGGVAQLGEHLPCKQGVMGSIPIISTTGKLPAPSIDKASANKYRDGEVKQNKGEERTRYTEELTWAHSSGG